MNWKARSGRVSGGPLRLLWMVIVRVIASHKNSEGVNASSLSVLDLM